MLNTMIDNIQNNSFLLNFISSNLNIDVEKKQKLFDTVIDGASETEFEKLVLNNAKIKELI